jgi:NAD(P) transhydrogenase subunit alpha
MKPGSVLVDLAVEQGGNVEGSVAGKVVEKGDVKIVGHHNVPSRLATSAATLYAKNLLNLLNLIIKDGALSIDWEDDIIKGVALTKGGKVIHPVFAKSAAAAPAKKETAAKKAPAKKSADKKPAAKKATAKKAAPKKAAASKTTAKKTTAKSSTAKKTTTKKTASK